MIYKGAIFDMDGVLVDSERLYMRFWQEACAFNGFEMTGEMALSLRSNSPETAIPKFRMWFGESADYYGIRELRRKLMAEYIDKSGVDLKPGAQEIIEYLKQKGIKTALATASPVKRARHYLEPHGLFDKLDAVVSGTSVPRSKPAPDIYLAAAGLLGIPPQVNVPLSLLTIRVESASPSTSSAMMTSFLPIFTICSRRGRIS